MDGVRHNKVSVGTLSAHRGRGTLKSAWDHIMEGVFLECIR